MLDPTKPMLHYTEVPGAVSLNQVQELVEDIQSLLTEDLRRPKYRKDPCKVKGHCYVASEAIYHILGGVYAPVTISSYQMKWEGDSHWFLKIHRFGSSDVIDPTAEQFEHTPEYSNATWRPFMHPSPSFRARTLMHRYYDAKLRLQLPSQIEVGK